jgi:MurNAc alpha-1-phosphate uridylyltransferase
MVNNPPHHPEGDFALHNGRVCREGVNRLTFSGISVLHPDLFAGCTPGRFPLAPLLLYAMADGRIGGEYYPGVWRDIGTPERLRRLDEELNARELKA